MKMGLPYANVRQQRINNDWTMRLIFILISFLIASPAWVEPLMVGQKAPNWMLSNLDQETVLLYEEAEAGNTTVMLFWTSWCKGCKHLMPAIEKLKTQTKDKAVKFYALNVWDESDSSQELKNHPTSLKILPKAENVAKRFNIQGTPGLIVVAPDKTIKYIRPASASIETTIKSLESILLAEN